MKKYWIGVASHEHVKNGIKDGIAQLCHGKEGLLKRMKHLDWLIYYSPVELFRQKEPCRKFTAIGQVRQGEPYKFRMFENFTPWRRDVGYVSAQATPIEPLVDQLSFIKDKQRWGFPFRWGFFEIPQSDFEIIAQSMKARIDE